MFISPVIGDLLFDGYQQTQAPLEEAVPEPIMEAEDEQSPAFTMSM